MRVVLNVYSFVHRHMYKKAFPLKNVFSSIPLWALNAKFKLQPANGGGIGLIRT